MSTNVLYRAPDAFRFLAGVSQLLPQEQEGNYPSHWRVNQTVLQQVRHIVAQIEAVGSDTDTHAVASREILFMQLLVLLRKSSLAEEATNNDARLNQLLAWLEDHFAQEICWEEVAAQFSLSLRTLHRQLKQQTGLTPQRYLNRVRLMKARHLLRHSDESVTDIAYRCGFGDSNHFRRFFAGSSTGRRAISARGATPFFSNARRVNVLQTKNANNAPLSAFGV